jgi:hypothetical protein
MPDSLLPANHKLVEGRACGSCNVCCVALAINDPELRKLPGYRCSHAQPDNSCGIYATRPKTCREFYCGWRHLKWIREPLRPDRSGVLAQLHIQVGKDGVNRLGVKFTLLNAAALRAEGLAETIAAGVAADVPVYLAVPGPPGWTAATARINEVLFDAVTTMDKRAVLQILRQAWARGRRGKRERVVLPPPEEGAAAPGSERP